MGTYNWNTTEIAEGLSIREDGSFNLITVLPDDEDVLRPAIIYADRFGEEANRVFLSAEEPILSEIEYTAAAAEGEYYLMGLDAANFRLIKANTEGEILWSNSLPQGNTPRPTKVAELPDGNLMVVDSYFDRETEALFPIIVRTLDRQGNELSSFSNEQITLRSTSPIEASSNGSIFVAGSNFNNSTGYLAANKYGRSTINWTAGLQRRGYANHIASFPSSHSDHSVGVLLVSSFDTTGSAISSEALSYIQIDTSGQEIGRVEFSHASSVYTEQIHSYAEDSIVVAWGQSDNSLASSHTIELVSISTTTLETGRELTIRSPFGPAAIAGVDFLTDGKVAVLFTSTGSAESYSSDIILVVLNQDGTITDIQKPQSLDWTLKIYPNPSHQLITAEISDQSIRGTNFYRMISTEGRVIFSGEFASNKMQLDISQIPTGTYFLQVGSATGDSSIKKILVR